MVRRRILPGVVVLAFLACGRQSFRDLGNGGTATPIGTTPVAVSPTPIPSVTPTPTFEAGPVNLNGNQTFSGCFAVATASSGLEVVLAPADAATLQTNNLVFLAQIQMQLAHQANFATGANQTV